MSSIAGRTGPEGSQERSQEKLEATELLPVDKSLHRRLRWGGPAAGITRAGGDVRNETALFG